MSTVYNFVIEGPDGVGKSTLAASLQRELSKVPGLQVLVIKEPNDLIQGLRAVAKHPKVADPDLTKISSFATLDYTKLYTDRSPSPEAAIYMMMASMAETRFFVYSLAEQSKKHNQELVVIHDRSVISTLIYQSVVPKRYDLAEKIWKAYSSMIPERFEATFVLCGRVDSIARRATRDCPYDRDLARICKGYFQVDSLFSNAIDYNTPSLLSLPSRNSFSQVFDYLTILDTTMYNQEQTLEFVLNSITTWFPELKPHKV